MEEVGNVFIEIKPSEKIFNSLKEQIRKFWPEVVYAYKYGSHITECFVYANVSSLRSWEKEGMQDKNKEKMFIINVLEDNYLIMIPSRHNKTEKFLWKIKEEIEKRFKEF